MVEVAGGYNFTVTEANGEPKTIFIPGGAALLSIIPELNGQTMLKISISIMVY